MACLNIEEIVKVADLGEPYDRLMEFLSFGDVFKLEEVYGGRQILFKRNSDDVAEDYPDLVKFLGMEKAEKTIEEFNGTYVYFPSIKRCALTKVYGALREEFDGYNHVRLAKKYGYTERHVRRIVGAVRKRTGSAKTRCH